MSDPLLFVAGCLVTLLCAAFVIVSMLELRRLGEKSDRQSGNSSSWR